MRKQLLAVTLLLCLLLSVPAAAEPIQSTDEQAFKTIGMFNNMLMDMAANEGASTGGQEVIGFDTNDEMLTALLAGRIDAFFAPLVIVEYYADRNEALTTMDAVPPPPPADLPETDPLGESSVGALMAVRPADEALRDQLNEAIAAMRADGTLDALAAEWIDGLSPEAQLTGTEMPVFADAPAYVVGVSGNGGPMDYMAVDGTPGGFNTALMAEIARRMQWNISFAPVNFTTDIIALQSGRIDIIFFMMDVRALTATEDVRDAFITTDSYYTMEGFAALVMK